MLTTELQRSPKIEEIAEYLDASVDEVLEAMESSSAYSSVPPEGTGNNDNDDAPSVLDRYATEDSALNFTDDRLIIEEALKGVFPREREVIDLRFLQGMTQIEIAEQLGISQVQVSRLLRRTLKKIQDKIDPEEGRSKQRGCSRVWRYMVRTPSRDDRDRSLKSAFLNVWTVIGCVIIFLIVLNLLGLLSGTLLFLAVGCISAFIASPLVNWLERHRVPRGAGALLGILVVIVAVLLLFVIAIPLMASQFLELLSHSPSWLSALGRWFVDTGAAIAAVFEHFFDTVKLDSPGELSLGDLFNQLASGLLASIKDGIVPIVNNIASTTFTVFLGLVLAYWLALD